MATLKERWDAAQTEERKLHTHTMESGLANYGAIYKKYFEHLGIDSERLYRKRIIEIGCADFPALVFCKKYHWGIVVEPMPSPILMRLASENIETLHVVPKCAEDYDFPPADEVWIFNVLQHVMDPLLIIQMAMKSAGIIRFFEPIDAPIDNCHLHRFTLPYFEKIFGTCTQYYPGGVHIVGFHQQECAYGVWEKQSEEPFT